MILFQMHIMWYEGKMVRETLDSLQQALDVVPDLDIKLYKDFSECSVSIFCSNSHQVWVFLARRFF